MILRLLGLLVTLTSLAHALSAPELTVRGARGGKAQLVIAEVKADVFLFADIACSTYWSRASGASVGLRFPQRSHRFVLWLRISLLCSST